MDRRGRPPPPTPSPPRHTHRQFQHMTNPDTLATVEQACADLANAGEAVTLAVVPEDTGLSI